MAALTIKDIAKLCGVSTSTVSRAINNETGINKETKERILETIAEYNFVPNNSARNLKMLDSNTIALLIKGIDNQFFQGMLHTFEDELNKIEYSFVVHAVGENQDEIAVAAELIKEKKLKGIIFLGGGHVENTDDVMIPLGVPYVRCTGAIEGRKLTGGCSITIDDRKESEKAVSYLIEKGHRRIAIFTAPDHSVGRLRLEGYKDALAKHGIPFDENYVRYSKVTDKAYSMENGYLLGKSLIEDGTNCTAIFAVSDNMAMGVYKAIYEAGMRIPQDYSIIGFDGLDMTRYYHPSLTTIQQPVEDMVKASIKQLMKAIDGQELKEHQILYEGTLLERDSVIAL